MTGKAVLATGMKLVEPLVCAGLKSVLKIPDGAVDAAVRWVKDRFTDHSELLTKAIATANERAWQAVALALAADTLLGKAVGVFRDGDLKTVQAQIRELLAATDFGPDADPDRLRVRACKELDLLMQEGRFGLKGVELTSLDLTRFASPAKVADDAHRAVHAIAGQIEGDAPHLARGLTLTSPAGGTPLLAAVFAYFLRRQIAANTELAHELVYDQVRQLTHKQQAGFANIESILEERGVELLHGLKTVANAIGREKTVSQEVPEIAEVLSETVRRGEVLSQPVRSFKYTQQESNLQPSVP